MPEFFIAAVLLVVWVLVALKVERLERSVRPYGFTLFGMSVLYVVGRLLSLFLPVNPILAHASNLGLAAFFGLVFVVFTRKRDTESAHEFMQRVMKAAAITAGVLLGFAFLSDRLTMTSLSIVFGLLLVWGLREFASRKSQKTTSTNPEQA